MDKLVQRAAGERAASSSLFVATEWWWWCSIVVLSLLLMLFLFSLRNRTDCCCGVGFCCWMWRKRRLWRACRLQIPVICYWKRWGKETTRSEEEKRPCYFAPPILWSNLLYYLLFITRTYPWFVQTKPTQKSRTNSFERRHSFFYIFYCIEDMYKQNAWMMAKSRIDSRFIR